MGTGVGGPQSAWECARVDMGVGRCGCVCVTCMSVGCACACVRLRVGDQLSQVLVCWCVHVTVPVSAPAMQQRPAGMGQYPQHGGQPHGHLHASHQQGMPHAAQLTAQPRPVHDPVCSTRFWVYFFLQS